MDTSVPPPIQVPPSMAPVTGVRGSDKIWSILCHIAIYGVFTALIFPVIVYFAMKDESEFVTANAREAINFHLSVLVYGALCWALCFLFIGFVLLPLLAVFVLVCAIVAAIKAADGGCYRYPMTIRFFE